MGIDDLADTPHVVVDGAARKGSVLTLSHWPRSATPRGLARDLSAEIAFAALARRRPWPAGVRAVTNDHFDSDGLAGVFALNDPARAEPLAERLVAFAAAGDFDIASDPAAAASVLAAAALVDPERGALLAAEDLADTNRRTACAYEALLPRLPEILEHPERFARHYAEEQAALDASRRLIEGGDVRIEENGELDLAVVTLSRSAPWSHHLGHGSALPLHPIALHSASRCSRMLVLDGARRAYHDRYETWVAYCSRRLPRRRDLAPLAARLNELEHSGASWRADSPGALVAALAHEGESDLAPDLLVELLAAHLRAAPPAWDPFAPPTRG